jgi:hypothetical protein
MITFHQCALGARVRCDGECGTIVDLVPDLVESEYNERTTVTVAKDSSGEVERPVFDLTTDRDLIETTCSP